MQRHKDIEMQREDSSCFSTTITVAFFVMVAVSSGFMVLLGPTPITRHEIDVSVLLDGGWRVFQGQIPHVDFYTPLGPVTPLLIALGMVIAGPSTLSIAYANIVLFIIVSFCVWFISRPRMSATLSFVLALYTGLLVISTYVEGQPLSLAIGYAMLYNRYGSALLVVVLVESFAHLKDPAPYRSSLVGGFTTGVLLVLLFFLKLNYFGMALLGVLFGLVIVPQSRYRWIGLTFGIALTALGMLVYLRFDIFAMKHDLAMGIDARSGDLIRDLPLVFQYNSFLHIFLLFMLWWLAPIPLASGHFWLHPKIRQGLVVVFIGMAQFALFLSNSTSAGRVSSEMFPLAALLVLAESGSFSYDSQKRNNSQIPRISYAFLFQAWFIIGIILFADVMSLGYSVYWNIKVQQWKPEQRFNSSTMADFSCTSVSYVNQVNDGFALLRQQSTSDDRIFTMSFANPFPFGLARPNPRGDAMWWHKGKSFTENVHLMPEKIFQDVTIVMVPKGGMGDYPTFVLMQQLYQDYITQHFEQVAESAAWTLYKKPTFH